MNRQTTNREGKSRQREFFAILEEFFQRATGKSPNDFATFESFGDEIRNNATELTKRIPDAFRFVWDTLPQFYEGDRTGAFEEARQAAGLKFVLGGTSRFGKTQFDSVRKMLLLCRHNPNPGSGPSMDGVSSRRGEVPACFAHRSCVQPFALETNRGRATPISRSNGVPEL